MRNPGKSFLNIKSWVINFNTFLHKVYNDGSIVCVFPITLNNIENVACKRNHKLNSKKVLWKHSCGVH